MKINGNVHFPEYEPGTKVRIGKTKFSSLSEGDEGIIVARHPAGGYAVEVQARLNRLFGNAPYRETATVFLEPKEFTVPPIAIVNDNAI